MNAGERDPGQAGGSVLTSFGSRLAARTRLRRWSRTRTVAVVVGIVAVVGVVVWVVLGSSLFAVRTVRIDGATGSVAASVRARVGDVVGKPLARVDTGQVESAVGSVRSVGAVTVHRSWPHTLTVDVVLRRSAAYTAASGGGYEILDPSGVVVRTTTRRPAGLVGIDVGTGVDAQLADGVTVLAAVPPSIRPKVAHVDVVSGQDVRLTLDNGVEIRWGSADDSAQKALVLAALVKHRARVYDVSAPDLPTTRR